MFFKEAVAFEIATFFVLNGKFYFHEITKNNRPVFCFPVFLLPAGKSQKNCSKHQPIRFHHGMMVKPNTL